MTISRNYQIAGLVLAICGLQSAAGAAEETLLLDTPKLDTPPVQRAPLSGKVSVVAEPARAPKKVAPPKVAPKIVRVTQPILNARASANTYKGIPMQATIDQSRQQIIKGYTNASPAPAMRAQATKSTNPDDAPYRWAQSGGGGYYDASGTYKGSPLNGDKLAAFGGRFYDGTPVPKGPVELNQLGHIWWDNRLSNKFVKRF